MEKELTKEEHVLKLYKEGLNISDISAKFDISLFEIKKNLRKHIKTCDFCNCSQEKLQVRNNTRFYCMRHYRQLAFQGKLIPLTKFDSNTFIKVNNYYEVYCSNSYTPFLISEESFSLVSQYKWSIRKDGYVVAKIKGSSSHILLHRLLMSFPEDLVVDHINRNKLDNRLDNLRVVSQSKNQANKSKMKNNTSGVTGVTWDKSRNKWKVSLNVDGKTYNIGRFDDLEVAKSERLKAELIYHGEFIPTDRGITEEDFIQMRGEL